MATSMLDMINAALTGDFSRAEELLKTVGVNDRVVVTNKSSGGKLDTTALHVASMMGRTEVVRFLLDHGANVQAEDERGRTAYEASKSPEVRQILLDKASNLRPAFCHRCRNGVNAGYPCEKCGRLFCEVCSGMCKPVQHQGFTSYDIRFKDGKCPRCDAPSTSQQTSTPPSVPMAPGTTIPPNVPMAPGVQLTRCAWCMIVNGIFLLAFAGLSLLGNVLLLASPDEKGSIIGVLGALVGCGLATFVLFGGTAMLKRRNYSLCIAASAVAVMPCCTILSPVIGIVSLVALSNPEIKSLFAG